MGILLFWSHSPSDERKIISGLAGEPGTWKVRNIYYFCYLPESLALRDDISNAHAAQLPHELPPHARASFTHRLYITLHDMLAAFRAVGPLV